MKNIINIDGTLEQIAKKYRTNKLYWDERSESFVESVCTFFVTNDRITDRQIAALVKISREIRTAGKKKLPQVRTEPDGPGFMGLNCKTGEVNWYSWQEFERG